jgi:hypothetical protein
MTVVINGDTGVTSVNGSAAAPSVTGADADTGIVYGTNTLSLATGGVTAVTVDSSQNVALAAGLTVTGTATATTFSGSGASLTNLPAPAALSTASGSAPSYSARAWVNFNGTGTVAIRASGNVSSVSDGGTGNYTVNFSTAMADANYSAVSMTVSQTNQVARQACINVSGASSSALPLLTGSTSSAALVDLSVVCVAVFS